MICDVTPLLRREAPGNVRGLIPRPGARIDATKRSGEIRLLRTSLKMICDVTLPLPPGRPVRVRGLTSRPGARTDASRRSGEIRLLRS